MKKWLMTGLLVLGLAGGVSAELVENGNFAQGVNDWQVNLSHDYGGADPEASVDGGELRFSRLHSVRDVYYTVYQPVDIREGRRYRLSFEAQGGGGSYRVVIRELSLKQGGIHHAIRPASPSASWEKVEAEFTGAYDTDQDWLKKMRKLMGKNKLKGPSTPNREAASLGSGGEGDGPSRSLLIFAIGEVFGTFSLRNISITEIGSESP